MVWEDIWCQMVSLSWQFSQQVQRLVYKVRGAHARQVLIVRIDCFTLSICLGLLFHGDCSTSPMDSSVARLLPAVLMDMKEAS